MVVVVVVCWVLEVVKIGRESERERDRVRQTECGKIAVLRRAS